MCSYANFRAFFLGAILVHARHRGNTGVLNESPQPDLDCELGYCHTCCVGLRRGAAWCGAGAQQCGAAQGRSSVGLRGGVARGCAGAQQRGAAQGRSAGPRMGAAWGRGGVQQCGAAQGRSAGLRRGAAEWGHAGEQQHGAAQRRSSVGLRRGVAALCCVRVQRGATNGAQRGAA